MTSPMHPVCLLINGALVDAAAGVRRQPLALEAGRIVDMSPVSRVEWTRDLSGHLIFPGLINAHDHLHRNAIPARALPAPGGYYANAYDWSNAWPPHLSDPDVAAVLRRPTEALHWHGALKNLLSGVTTVAHHDAWHGVFEDPAFPVRVLSRFGWSHSLGFGLRDRYCSAPRFGPAVVESFAATPPDQPWVIHLAEGIDGVAAAELAKLDALHCLAPNTLLIHGVGLSDRDITRIVECGAGVVWCPGSNMAILGKTLEPRRLIDAGRLALATDSRLSGCFDLLAEMRMAAELSDCSPKELLALVTEAPGRLLRMPEIGGLAAGQNGDLLIVREPGPDSPDACTALLNLRRADIRAVVRGGRPAVADPDFADWFAVCDIAVTRIFLDGKPKLIDAALLGPDAAFALEAGLTLGAAMDKMAAEVTSPAPSPWQGEGAGEEPSSQPTKVGLARSSRDFSRRPPSESLVSGLPTLEPLDAYALWAASYPPHAHNPVMLAEERAMLSMMPTDLAGMVVLDAGCGSGRYLRHMVDRGAQCAIGVDLSEPMLRRAFEDPWPIPGSQTPWLVRGGLSALPVQNAQSDLTVCALALGHLPDLAMPLQELSRVTRPGGRILCSDFHPIGAALGWTRDFKAGGEKYVVRYTAHSLADWRSACREAGLIIETVLEPSLDPADVPSGARFDVRALEIPVVLVLALRRVDKERSLR